ncbi:MAG: M14 family metallopeptidase [Eubacteriales bacterium]|nr:M14 family metallopeptidase [Eubacteriales bacterium]
MRIDDGMIRPGEKKQMALQGFEQVKVQVIRGAYPGKQLVITAGMHGCEYVGIRAAAELYRLLDPQKMHGTVVLLPLLNPSGFFQGRRQIMPEDGKNLNRVFPGTEQGSSTERLAAAVVREIYPDTDFLLDLHGGDANEDLTPLVFYPAAAGQLVEETAVSVAEKMSVPLRVASRADNGLYSRAAKEGIPGLLLERGCRGLWTEEEVHADLENIRQAMEALGILKPSGHGLCRPERGLCQPERGIFQSGAPQTDIREAVYEEAEAAGWWYVHGKAGDRVREGALLGELRDENGTVIQRVRARWDGVILYETVFLGVQAGDPLVACGRL